MPRPPNSPSQARAAVAPIAALITALITALTGVLVLGGCAVQPWVKPYEREHLADPLMQLGDDTLAAVQREHIHAVREAARGATGVQGGGCGCN